MESTHAMGTDAPGRTHSSGTGGRRSAMEPTDLHAVAEHDFLRTVAHDLNHRVASAEIDALIIVAPARALGILRDECSAPLRKVLRAELDRDYVRMPVHEIEKHLSLALK